MTSNDVNEVGSDISITRPRPGPRRGSLRTVTIQPLSLARPEPLQDAVAVQGVLPLAGLSPSEGASPPWSTQRRTARPGRGQVPEVSDADLAQIARQVCRGVAEVLAGDRPANQLLRCTSERVYVDISRRSASAKSRRRMTQERVAHTRVERIRIQRPNPKAVEVCARLRRGNRIHALAARLEFQNGRWTCVALEDDLNL